MIRYATTEQDVIAVASFMKRFEESTQFVKVDPAHAARVYWPFIQKGIGVFIVLEDDGELIGGLGALKYPDLHDGKLTAVETFWFVSPEHRGKGMELFNAFESWGVANGCTKLAMIHLADSYPSVLEKIYQRKGYHLAEKHYIKEL